MLLGNYQSQLEKKNRMDQRKMFSKLTFLFFILNVLLPLYSFSIKLSISNHLCTCLHDFYFLYYIVLLLDEIFNKVKLHVMLICVMWFHLYKNDKCRVMHALKSLCISQEQKLTNKNKQILQII